MKNFSPEYREYMQSEAWRDLRSRVLQRDQCRCRDCGKASPSNDVHHLTYIRLGSENLADLVTLCRECHDRLHCVQDVKRYLAPSKPPQKAAAKPKRKKSFMDRVNAEIERRKLARQKPPKFRKWAGPNAPERGY